MRRHFLHYIPRHDCIHCRRCRIPVAFVEDYVMTVRIRNVPIYFPSGIFNRVFNVIVPDGERYRQYENGNTLLDTFCVQCQILLGWKYISVPQPSMYVREGTFYMKLHKLIFWDDVPLLCSLYCNGQYVEGLDIDEDGEEAPNDQDGGANQQAPNEQDGRANDEIDNIDPNPDLCTN